MDWEKPCVSIPAARTATAGPGAYIRARALSGFSSFATTGSVPIRAPLTIEDDDQEDEDEGSSFESRSPKSASNDASSQSSVIDSGTDEGFESASVDTDEETAEEDADLSRIRVYRSTGENPDGETGEGSAFNVRSRVYSSSVGNRDEEASLNYSSFGEEEGENGREVYRVSPKARMVIPRARLSLDDDEVDQVLSSGDEDNGLLGVFEGPSTRTVARVKCPSIVGEEEEVGEKSSEVGESNLVDKPEFTDSVISGEEETMGMNYSDTGSMSLETVEGNSLKETVHVTDSSSHELDVLMISDEGSVGLGSGELRGEDMGNMIREAEIFRGNDCCIVSELGKPECIIGTVSGMRNPETFHMNPKVESESESAAKRYLKGMDENLVLPNKDVIASGFSNSVGIADGTVENMELSLLPVNNQFVLKTDGQVSQISVKAEDSLSLSDKDEIIVSGSSTVITYEKAENEEEMAPLIHDHTFTEFDEYEAISDRREELLDYTSQCSSEESSSEHFVGRLSEEEKVRIEKLQLIRAKLLRLIRTLGLPVNDSIASEVLAELALSSGKHRIIPGFYTESDEMKMMNPRGEIPDDEFSVNILVLGKTGVGKSATINSIFCETKSPVGAFGLTTKSTKFVIGNVGGIRIRILDTPGLCSSAAEERFNRKVLLSIKKRMRKFPIDIVLYIDRLDEHLGGISDIQLLRSITCSLGSSIWKNAIVILTHAGSVVPDSSYNDFIAQRSYLLQQWISQAVPEPAPSMMPRVVLAENNQNSFPKNKAGECVFVNWRQQLLLLCFSAKIMSEANSSQKQETLMEKSKIFNFPLHSFSLFHSLWNLLLYRAHPRLVSHPCNKLEPSKPYFSDPRPEKLCKEKKRAYSDEHRLLEKKQQAEARKIPGNGANNSGFEERTNLGIQAKAGEKGFVLCFDTLDVKTGVSIGEGGSKTFFSVGSDNEREEQILLRMRGWEQMQIAAVGVVIPLVISLVRRVYCENTQKNSK